MLNARFESSRSANFLRSLVLIVLAGSVSASLHLCKHVFSRLVVVSYLSVLRVDLKHAERVPHHQHRLGGVKDPNNFGFSVREVILRHHHPWVSNLVHVLHVVKRSEQVPQVRQTAPAKGNALPRVKQVLLELPRGSVEDNCKYQAEEGNC